MKNPKQKWSYVAVIFVMGGLFFLLRKNSTSKLIQESPSPSESTVNSQQTPISNLTHPSEPKPALMKVIALDRAERKIGLKRMPLEIQNQEAVLSVELVLKGTCFPGDADAIEKDLKAAPEHKLLATLETLSGSNQPLYWPVPENFLALGSAKREFKIPVSEEPKQFGFYLCTALSSEKSCRDKITKDLNEIFSEHLRNDPQAGKEPRNFFFQYLLIDNRGLAAFTKPPKGEKPFEELKNYVRERTGVGPIDKEVSEAQKKMNTLISFPVAFKGKTLRIELPKYNLAACEQ